MNQTNNQYYTISPDGSKIFLIINTTHKIEVNPNTLIPKNNNPKYNTCNKSLQNNNQTPTNNKPKYNNIITYNNQHQYPNMCQYHNMCQSNNVCQSHNVCQYGVITPTPHNKHENTKPGGGINRTPATPKLMQIKAASLRLNHLIFKNIPSLITLVHQLINKCNEIAKHNSVNKLHKCEK